MLLESLVPEYHYGEVHSTRLSAPPERALAAVRSVTLGEMPLVRLLFAVRSLPELVAGKRGLPTGTAEPLYEQMLDFGFVLLAEEPGRELVFGGIGQMFRASGGSRPVLRDADGFRAFGKPGYAKVAMNFSAEARAGGVELRTETRVLATDAASRRRFGRYWRLIRPGSALIRRTWLRAAKRRIQRATLGTRSFR
ncbi:MAG TPA: hypothetical protein VF068_13710 [Rubrobacter sp.]